MAGQFDYTVNIPQPPAQNFLQSLLGIQQLKGLQQQQDIQGQQAQFAQQMQPLQIQTEQARLGQISQATETGAENLRQSKITFEESQAVKEQTKKLFGELQGMSANAPIEDVVKITNKLALINPPAAKQVNDNYNKLLEQYQNNVKIISTQARSLLEAGKYQDAADHYNEAAKAVKDKAGNNQNLLDLAKGYEIQAKLSISSPVAAKTGIATLLGVIDPPALTAITAYSKENAKAELERPLPSAIQKINKDLEDKAKAFDANAAQASNVLEKLTSVPGWDTYYLGKKKITEIQNFFSPQQELVLKNEEERLNKMEGLSEEARKQGRGIGSVRMMQLATSLLPDPWTNPKAAAEKLKLQIETSNRFSKIYNAEVEWNATFVGKNATKDTEIAGVEVKKGQPKSSFISAYKDYMFPKDEVIYAPALDALKSEQNPAARKKSAHDQSLKNAARRGAAGAGLGQRVPGTNATFELLPE